MSLRVCVIGAGASGLVSIKECISSGFEVVCYERTSWVAGLWKYHESNEDGVPSVFASTVANASKEMSAFSDFPPDASLPMFFHNRDLFKYFDSYADHFQLKQHIHFHHQVVQVFENNEDTNESQNNKKWSVKVMNTNTKEELKEQFDAVIVCSGHHGYPYIPSFPGQDLFRGRILHTHKYKKANGFEGLNVCVVGIGNSGGDAAAELSSVASKCYLSTRRRGGWIIPRTGPFGLPFDMTVTRRFLDVFLKYLPTSLANSMAESLANHRFDHELYGVRPQHNFFQQKPTLNDHLPFCIMTGNLVIKGNIERFTESGVIFEGETDVTPLDAVIFATGYNLQFPFLSDKIVPFNDKNQVNLFKFQLNPNLSDPASLSFIGLIEPLGAQFPLTELQIRWTCQLLLKSIDLPSKKGMLQEIEETRKYLSSRYYTDCGSMRHKLQADWITFMDDIASRIGVKPNLYKIFFTDPILWAALLFGPSLPYQYRLQGINSNYCVSRRLILTVSNRITAGTERKGDKQRTSNLIHCFGQLVAAAPFFLPPLTKLLSFSLFIFILLSVTSKLFF